MYLHKTPFLIKKLYPSLIWNEKRNTKKIYLTFDDGPIPEVTEFVLEELKKTRAKATFFCVGENIHKHPSVFQKIIAEEHSVGNHTYNHLNGYKTSLQEYSANIEKCKNVIEEWIPSSDNLFRPPYGRITKAQIKTLKRNYKIVMWDVLSGDFDKKLPPEKCLNAVIKNSKAGSILVFHDNIKTYSTLKFVLPKVLEYFQKKGFSFEKLGR